MNSSEKLFNDNEQRIDLMLERANQIMQKAIEKYNPVVIFAGLSGGKDSIVSTHFSCENYGAIAVHANTLTGVQPTLDYTRNICKKFNWQLIEKEAKPEGPPKYRKVKTKNGEQRLPTDFSVFPNGRWQDGETAYEEFCFNFGMPGPGQHGRMYQRLKERSFNAMRRDFKKSKKQNVMFVTGIRRDESSIRAGYNRAVSKVGSSVWVNPFYWTTAYDFHLYREEFGLPVNPVSRTIGISGECLCGTMGDRSELDLIAKVDPQRKAYIESLESRCESLGLPCKWATKPPRKSRCDKRQLELFGPESDFQPACVGCLRRNHNAATTSTDGMGE